MSSKTRSTFNIYLMFTLSGAAALIYQILWARWLGLIFGNTTTSISIVLGSFMLGLALGSWIAGRRLHRTADPMLAYVRLEAGIGIFAVLFPLLTSVLDRVFTASVDADSPVLLLLSVKAALSFVLLAVPTTLMGATLPLLTEFFRRSPRHSRGWKVGLLYAANTLGAALGTIAASYFLIELMGIRSTTLLAAVFNFVVAYAGYRISRGTPLRPPEGPPEGAPVDRPLDLPGKLAIGVLAAGGATALASEVLWTRALETVAGNSTYAFALILIVYLLGIAAGSWIMSLVVHRRQHLVSWLVALQVGMGLWTVVSIRLFHAVGAHLSRFSNVPISAGALLWSHLQAISLLMPLAVLSGAVFPVATRILDPRAEDAAGALIARAYSWNTVGALLGSLVGGFGIAVFFDYFQALYLLAALYALTATAVVAVVVARRSRDFPLPTSAVLGALALALVVLGLVKTHQESRFVRSFDDSPWEVVFHEPGIHGITSALRRRDAPLAGRLLVNGKGMTAKLTDTKVMAHLPMLLHPKPDNTLIICFGMGTSYRSAITHGGRVTAVELVEEVFAAFDQFYDDAERVRAYAQGKMVVNDGRNFLKLTRDRFDIISIDPPPPIDAAGVNNLYSKEFLELTRSRLRDDGIMAHWIPSPGTLAGVDDWDTFNLLLATFAEVYPHAIVLRGWTGAGMHVLGSRRPIRISGPLLRQRMTESVLRDLREWDRVPLSYFQGIESLGPSEEISPNLVTDDRPRLEFNLLRSWRAGVKKAHPPVDW